MTIPTRAGVIAIGAVALAIGLSGCGSDTKTEESTSTSASASEAEPSSAAPTTSAAAAGPKKSIAEYVKENNITETPVKRGDPGSPTINLPVPQGWDNMGADKPDWAYGGIVFTGDPAMKNPPTIIAIVSKLTGNVDPAKILEYAPGEIQSMEGYQGPGTGQPSKLSGFDATQVGGTYTRDGVSWLVAQKTVVIPGQDGLFVLRLKAEGTEDQAMQLMDATKTIDDQTRITP